VPLALLLAALSLRAAAIAAAALAVFGWLLGRWRASYRQATRCASRQHERLVETADDSVRHADLWVSYGAEANVRANVRRLGDAVADGWARLAARAAALSGANEVLGAAALAVAIGAARAGWLGTIGTGGTLLAFAVTFFLAYRPLRELADATAFFARAQVAYDELHGVIDRAQGRVAVAAATARPREADPSAAPTARAWPLAPLELGALRLARGTGRPITLRVAAGAIAVITGPTGAGKTTLLRTLLGLESALDGDVVYGGSSLRDSPAGPSARPFAWVPQDAPLLADTLSANIGLGASGVDARAVLEPLGASHLVQQLDASRLGESGRAVSGGERQWISLARAIATRQPVLLLDEPTSGLDPQAQRMVLDAVDRLRGERTVILVTHRSEPLAIADLVVRIDACEANERAA
jgi:ABC-type multidrug transport system fused ATPase/permease subunit